MFLFLFIYFINLLFDSTMVELIQQWLIYARRLNFRAVELHVESLVMKAITSNGGCSIVGDLLARIFIVY
jgi:hypothetical protein